MKKSLEGKTIAILATNGFEESEFTEPMKHIKEAGGTVKVVSLTKEPIKSWTNGNWGKSFEVDEDVETASADNYDGLMLPGGVINPDSLRKNKKAVNFVKSFFDKDKQKPVGAICHGPWMLAEAGVTKGRKMTSYDSIKTDMKNAGADWCDEEVVVDNGLITSRNPDDLPAFCSKLVEEYKEGKHSVYTA